MIILRFFLYLICIISIGWSILVFGGPLIVKKFILGYSDGTVVPSGITVSPRLNIDISRLDFISQNGTAGDSIEGFSRAAEIEWSLFGEKPFLEINIGPTVLKDYANAENIYIYTPPFKKIDWQNTALASTIDGLTLASLAEMRSLILKGNLNLEEAELSNINIQAKKFRANDGRLTYSAGLIESVISQLSIDTPLKEQIFSSTFLVKDIIVHGFDLKAPKATIEVVQSDSARHIKIDLHDANILDFGSIKNVNVDGSFNHLYALQELQIDLDDGVLFNSSSSLKGISMRVNKSGDEQYEVYVEGSMDELELSGSDNFIGILPSSNFVINMEFDKETSTIASKSKIRVDTLNPPEIISSVEMEFSSEPLAHLACSLWECELSNFELVYQLDFDDEWVRGSANCRKAFCRLREMDHLIRTSHTGYIFTALSRKNILNPLSSLYMYGVISSGQKIDAGHELKFKF